MKPYSAGLRERGIVVACAEDGRLVGEMAAQFRVSASFAHKLRRRMTGSLVALPHRGGPVRLLDAAARAGLSACVARPLDATLDDLRGRPAAAGAPAAGRTTVRQALQALGLRRKKRAFTPPSATPSG